MEGDWAPNAHNKKNPPERRAIHGNATHCARWAKLCELLNRQEHVSLLWRCSRESISGRCVS